MTHAGIGSVLLALTHGHRPVVMPRRSDARRGGRRSPGPLRARARGRRARDRRRRGRPRLPAALRALRQQAGASSSGTDHRPCRTRCCRSSSVDVRRGAAYDPPPRHRRRRGSSAHTSWTRCWSAGTKCWCSTISAPASPATCRSHGRLELVHGDVGDAALVEQCLADGRALLPPRGQRRRRADPRRPARLVAGTTSAAVTTVLAAAARSGRPLRVRLDLRGLRPQPADAAARVGPERVYGPRLTRSAGATRSRRRSARPRCSAT